MIESVTMERKFLRIKAMTYHAPGFYDLKELQDVKDKVDWVWSSHLSWELKATLITMYRDRIWHSVSITKTNRKTVYDSIYIEGVFNYINDYCYGAANEGRLYDPPTIVRMTRALVSFDTDR